MNIITITRKYIAQSLVINTLVLILGFILVYLTSCIEDYYTPLLISYFFNICASLIVGLTWKHVVTKHPESITTYHTATSGFRMLAAIVLMTIVYTIVGRDNMMPYGITFIIFYFLMIGHHSFFFSNKINKQ